MPSYARMLYVYIVYGCRCRYAGTECISLTSKRFANRKLQFAQEMTQVNMGSLRAATKAKTRDVGHLVSITCLLCGANSTKTSSTCYLQCHCGIKQLMNCSLASLYTGLIANSIFSATVVDSRRLLEDASLAFAWNSERETAPTQQYYLLQHHQCLCPMPGPDVWALCFDVILPTENAEPGLVDLCKHHTSLNCNMGLFCYVQFFPWDYCHMWRCWICLDFVALL